jgi:hypothetical protein
MTDHCVPFPLSLVSWVCSVCFFSDLFALSHRSIDRPATNQIQSRKLFNPVPTRKKEKKKRPKLGTMAS